MILLMKDPSRKPISAGFTLVEIIIVVFILGLLVAIAVPNFLRMRMNANEDLIRADLRAFSTGNESYRTMQNPIRYSPDIQTLANQNYIDNTWVNPANKHGYGFTYSVDGSGMMYSLEAVPLTPNVTGVNAYCVDQTGSIVWATAGGMGTGTGCVGGTAITG